MAARDWSKLYRQHRGQWVALADDRMTAVAHGGSRREVKEAAVKLRGSLTSAVTNVGGTGGSAQG